MSDETIRLEYWQCVTCNSVYHIDPLDTLYKVDINGLVHCAKDKIPMLKLKRKPAKQVPNIGLTNTIFLRELFKELRGQSSYTPKNEHFRYMVDQLTYSIEWQIKNRKLLDIVEELEKALDREMPLKQFWSEKYLDVEFEV